MSPWAQGRATVDQLLAAGKVEHVPANLEAARALVDKSRVHLQSAAMLADRRRPGLRRPARSEPQSPHRGAARPRAAPHSTRRTRRGLRRGSGPARPAYGLTLAPYSRIRRARNAGDYLDELPATGDDVRGDLPLCEAIVGVADKILGQMPPY